MERIVGQRLVIGLDRNFVTPKTMQCVTPMGPTIGISWVVEQCPVEADEGFFNPPHSDQHKAR